MDNAISIRQLVPTSYSFDGYNKVGCQDARGQPFWSNHKVAMGDYSLKVMQKNDNSISLVFQSVCFENFLKFQECIVSFEEFIEKLQEATKTSTDFITFNIVAQKITHIHEYCEICTHKNEDCENAKKLHSFYVAVSFDINDIRMALVEYHLGTAKKVNSKGGNTMASKFFGKDFEFGLNKNKRLASTLQGVAVQDPETGSWFTYDPVNRCHKNLARFKIGDFPIMLLPITREQIVPGTLLKRGNDYIWVNEVLPTSMKVVDVLSGEIKELLYTQFVFPGFDFYTSVNAMDMGSFKDLKSGNNMAGNLLAATFLMQWANNNKNEKPYFSLDKQVDNEAFNGLGEYLPLLLMNQGFNMKNFATYMALGAEEGDEATQMLILSQLMNSGNSAGNTFAGMFGGLGFNNTNPNPNGDGGMVCDTCHTNYPVGTNFCPKCGGKLHPVGNYCKNCGTQLMPGAVFCHVCGTKVGPPACPNCGAEVTKGASFCHMCGTRLNNGAVPVAQVNVTATQPASVVPAVPTVAQNLPVTPSVPQTVQPNQVAVVTPSGNTNPDNTAVAVEPPKN